MLQCSIEDVAYIGAEDELLVVAVIDVHGKTLAAKRVKKISWGSADEKYGMYLAKEARKRHDHCGIGSRHNLVFRYCSSKPYHCPYVEIEVDSMADTSAFPMAGTEGIDGERNDD